MFYWASQDSWKPVFTSSDPSEVQSAAAILEEKGVPYRISPDGLRLETTLTNVGRARIEAASAGKNPGFETLDNIKLGTSPQRERWAYQRALEGELVRTVNALDEVKASRGLDLIQCIHSAYKLTLECTLVRPALTLR